MRQIHCQAMQCSTAFDNGSAINRLNMPARQQCPIGSDRVELSIMILVTVAWHQKSAIRVHNVCPGGKHVRYQIRPPWHGNPDNSQWPATGRHSCQQCRISIQHGCVLRVVICGVTTNDDGIDAGKCGEHVHVARPFADEWFQEDKIVRV